MVNEIRCSGLFKDLTMRVSESNFKMYNSYALVTGAASGMGRLYCLRLAQMGYNLLMVDINAAGLEQTAAEVRNQVGLYDDFRSAYVPKFDIKELVIDLSKQSAASEVAKTAAGCNVEVLINNAGIMYCQKLLDTTERSLSLIMMLHMFTPLMICREIVPGMIERGRGYVLNISSLGAWMDWPGIGMYGNTKRFVKGFSRQLRIETGNTGVSVTNAYFGAVDTPLIPLPPKYRRLARFLRIMIPAEVAVDSALKATFKRRKGVMPGFVNHLFKPVISVLPDCVLAWMLKLCAPLLMKV